MNTDYISSKPLFRKSNNIDDDIKVLSSNINHLIEDFIAEYCDNDSSRVKDSFRHMVVYIADNMPKIDLHDTDIIDRLFNFYVSICLRFDRNPTVELYMYMLGLYDSYAYVIINDSNNKGLQREYQSLQHKWLTLTKGMLCDNLETSDKTSVNKIFLAKAKYGMYDQPQPQAQIDTKSCVSLDKTH